MKKKKKKKDPKLQHLGVWDLKTSVGQFGVKKTYQAIIPGP